MMNKLHLLSFDKSYTRNMCHERNIVNPWLIQIKCSSSSRVLNATNDCTILKNNLIPFRSGLFFSCQIRGRRGADSAPPWISALEPLLKLGWNTILEWYKRGPRIQKMRCLSSKLREWRPFENSDLKCDFLENCHWSSQLLSKIWEGRF